MRILYTIAALAVLCILPSSPYAGELCRPQPLDYYPAGHWLRSPQYRACPGVHEVSTVKVVEIRPQATAVKPDASTAVVVVKPAVPVVKVETAPALAPSTVVPVTKVIVKPTSCTDPPPVSLSSPTDTQVVVTPAATAKVAADSTATTVTVTPSPAVVPSATATVAVSPALQVPEPTPHPSGSVVPTYDNTLLFPKMSTNSISVKCGISNLGDAKMMFENANRLSAWDEWFLGSEWDNGYYVSACSRMQAYFPNISINPVNQPR